MSIEEEKNAPWLKSYGEVKFHIDYPKGSMSDVVLATADRYPTKPRFRAWVRRYRINS